MDKAELLENYLENPAYDFENFSDLQEMAEDYKYQQLMSQLQQEGLL
jgi:hypothetical protein